MAVYLISANEARARLTERWLEQCQAFPLMRHAVPLALYVRANMHAVRAGDLLKAYAK